MENMTRLLKYPAIWCLVIIALVSSFGHAAAVDSYAVQCGYGYKPCPGTHHCVYGPYRSTCQRKAYEPSTSSKYPSYSSPTPSPVYSGSTAPPDLLPSSSFSEYAPSSSLTAYSPSTSPTGYSASSSFTTYPPSDSSTKYSPSGSPTGYQLSGSPTGYPSGDQPSSSTPSYSASYPSSSTYQPSSSPTGYSPSYPSGYPPGKSYGGYSKLTCSAPGLCKNNTDGKNYYGITGVSGKVVERLPIDVLQKTHTDTFNMLLLALESLQGKDESLDLSYYQVSGIHGYPFIPWQYPPEATVNRDMGYCTHGSVLFTTWHRPYVLLLEQLLWEEAVNIAGKFSGTAKDKYLAAAQDLRLPYWDWAADSTQSRIPDVLSTTSISVTKPGSDGSETHTNIPNPLYDYRFLKPQPPESRLEATTLRGADPNKLLSQTFPGRKQGTFDLFALTQYNAFSNDTEGIHSTIHVLVGEDMAEVPTSAFDPIFWLHHCQVDRIMAMFQATHQTLALTPDLRSPTFALGGDGPDDLSTPLYPFRHDNGKEWISDDVKTAESIFRYGYAYPEVPFGRSGSDLQTFTTEAVKRLYGPNINGASFKGDESGAPQSPTARREWGATVEVDLEELPGSHRILIYIGPHNKNNPDNERNIDQLVGVAPIFTGPTPVTNKNRYLNFTVPLTAALVEKNVALRPEDTVPTLKEQLYWTVEKVGMNVQPIPVSDLKSLKISVTSSIKEYSSDVKKLPVKSDELTHYTPTAGKVGGLQPNDAPPVGSKAPPPLDNGVAGGNGTSNRNGTTLSS